MKYKENKNNLHNVIQNNCLLFKVCFATDPKYIFLYILDIIRNDINYFLEYAFGLNYILECVEFKKPISSAIGYLIFLFLFVALGMVYSAWFGEKYKLTVLPKIKANFKRMLFEKAKEVDLECYDNPEYYNNFIFAINESDNQVDRMFELLNKILVCIVNIALVGGFFIIQDSVSLIFILATFIFTLIFNKRLSKLLFKIRYSKNVLDRKNDYMNRVFYLKDYAKELRLNTKLSDTLFKEFKQTNNDIINIEKKNGGKRFLFSFMKDYVSGSLIRDILYIIYLLYRTMVLKAISYSTMVVLYRTANRLQNCMQSCATIYPYALETSLYIDKIKHFLNTKSNIVSVEKESIPKEPMIIEFKHVYFSYSNDHNYVLQDINMKINFPSKIAIVGFNGAGKTTLIKLIMRLYDVTKGEITLNGKNIKEYDINEYRNLIGVIFQDYKLYAATLAENVVLDKVKSEEKEAIIEALKKSSFDIKGKLQKLKLDNQLTKEFDDDGINLSGGESQKIAVSRVFYSDKPMIILDEPSSALDPISEYYLNKTMMELAENKQVIFISHRLSTTRLSDYIYVLESGRVVEHGSHEELLYANNIYASMWKAQAGHYNTENLYL